MFTQTFIIKAVAGVLIALLLSISLYAGYSHIKQIGYREAEVVYQKQIQDYKDSIGKKIDKIETLSTTLVSESRDNNEAVSKDIEDILKKVKGKPLVIVKDGECTPSKTFSDSIGELNKRANQAIKESQK